MMKKGKLYGVGLGPGDPELITVKAKRILESTERIFFPKRSAGDSGISSSILSGIIGEKPVTGLIFPMTSSEAQLEEAWTAAAGTIHSTLEAGSDAVFVSEGDPMFFSTFCYLLGIFKAKYPDVQVEVIPGITSFAASSARGLVPVGVSMGKVTVIPASSNIDEIERIIANKPASETLILMKIKSVFDRIGAVIERLSLPFLFVERCSMPGEVVITDIEKLKKHKPDYFSLMIIK